MAIKHTKVVTVPDDGTSPVGSDEWNDNHTIDDSTLSIAKTTGLQAALDLKAPLTSPTFVTPVLGTPASGVLTNTTGYTGDSSLVTTGTIATGVWNGTAVASAYLDSDTSHLSVAQTITGIKTFDTETINKIVTAPADPSAGYAKVYAKLVDSNNDGYFIKEKVGGSVVEVRIA